MLSRTIELVLDTQIECLKLSQWKEYTYGNRSQEDQLGSPSVDGKVMWEWSEEGENYVVAEQVQDSLKLKDIVEKAKNVSDL